MAKKKSIIKQVLGITAGIFLIISCVVIGYLVYVVYRPAPDCHPSLGIMTVNQTPTIFHKILGRMPPGICHDGGMPTSN